jgi:hypothetical protein
MSPPDREETRRLALALLERGNGGAMEELTVTALEELEGKELAAFAVSGNRIAIARVPSTRSATPARIRGARLPKGSSKARPSPALATEASST